MSKTLHQFGRVLFDELEQIAVRRGGFASLNWVKKNLEKAQGAIRDLREKAADPNIDLSSGCYLRLMSSVPGARATGTGDEDVIIVAAVGNSLHFRVFVGDRNVVMDADEKGLAKHEEQIEELTKQLEIWRSGHELTASERCRVITAVTSIVGQTLPSLRKRAEECTRQAGQALALADRTAEAVDQLGRIIDDVIKAAHEVEKRIRGFEQAQARPADYKVQDDRDQNVKENPEARFERICRAAWELKDVKGLQEDDARVPKEALDALIDGAGERLDKHGIYERLIRGAIVLLSDDLASSLGRKAKQLDQITRAFKTRADTKKRALEKLSGLVAEPPAASPHETYYVVEDAARKSAMRMGTVGLAFSGGGIRSATFNLGFLQGAAALGLLKQFDYLSTVSGGGYIGAWFAAWVVREGGGPGDPKAAPETDARMQRTAQALENVEKQLSSSRARQASAVRRWAWRANSPPLPSKPTVEDEPEAVHHLREHSNYLAPKIGLLSIDTWTMVSVYLRNLFLNQFIVLPMLLAVIALPRLVLFLFTHSTSEKMIALARAWLDHHRGWPERAVLGPAIVATLLVPRLMDIFAGRIVTRLHRRTVGWATLFLVVLGITAPATLIIPMLPSPVLAKVGGMVEALVKWLALSPWATGLVAGLLVILAAWFGPRINRRSAGDLERSVAPVRYEPVTAWGLLWILIFGTDVLAIWLPNAALKFVDSFVESFTGDREWLTGDRALFLGTFFMASVGFYGTYRTLAKIRWLSPAVPADHGMTKRIRWWRIWEPLLFLSSGLGLCLARPEWHYHGAAIVGTLLMASVGFWRTYQTLAQIRRRAPPDYRMTKQMVRCWVVMPLTFASLGVSLLFARPRKPFFVCPLYSLEDWFNPAKWEGTPYMAALCFGGLVGLMRLLSFLFTNLPSGTWIRTAQRAASAFSSGLISGAGLAAVLSWLRGLAAVDPEVYGPLMMSFGPALVMVAISAGSAIEGGLIGGYGQEDMREWRASLGAYLMMIGTFWAVLCVLSIYGPLFLWWASGWAAWALGAGLVVISVLGAMAGRSERTDGVKISKSPLEYLALIAPAAFTIGLVVAVSVLVTYLQGVDVAIKDAHEYLRQLSRADQVSTWAILLLSLFAAVVGCVHANINLFGLNAFYGNRLVRCYLGASRPREAAKAERPPFAPTNSPGPMRRPNPITGFDLGDDFPLHNLAIVRSWSYDVRLICSVKDVKEIPTEGKDLVVLAAVDTVLHFRVFDCDGNKVVDTDEKRLTAKAPRIGQFKEQLERLRPPRELLASEKVRLIATLTSILDRDFDDLVVNYRGPYHLINTAMNLVAGDDLAWQERKAESFILSPLYCGSKTTGYRPATKIAKCELKDDEVEPKDWWREPSTAMPGYGGDIRLGTAISVSGAAASPNAGYHSSPLVTILMTILNARLGLWFGNPARAEWRRSGPGFAFKFFHELFSRTTNRERYVYLSDGGHFENLGAYELVRRRCRYIVVCDAGADPGLAFWDLASLVRKCRQDFGIRIEIDLSPLLKKDGSPYAKWHCAVGQIHYDDVDVEALPGMLIYIKPSLSGDEPSDVCNYRVGHPTFPHESTVNQFFGESQFESYRELGEHIALDVFGDAVRDAGANAGPGRLFSRLRRRWAQGPPNLDKEFLESVKPFIKIHEALRTDPKLESLSHELYPKRGQPVDAGPGPAAAPPPGDDRAKSEGANPDHAPPPAAAPPPGDDRAHVHAVIEMVQVMENAWIALNLDVYSDQPLNRGWMNVFRRWISSEIFRTHWPVVRGEFSDGFVRFCESELNLTVQEPEFVWLEWLEGTPHPQDRPTCSPEEFCKGVGELDHEFSLEWPHLALHKIGGGRSGLAGMLECAREHRPVAGRPMAVLIRPHEGRPTSEPSYYGVILAWGSPDSAVELVVWLRGAFRTLGLGRAVKKTIHAFKKELEALDSFKTNGYILRTRYPSDERGRRTQRWQRTLWANFFQNQGFHRDDTDTLGNAPDTLIYRWVPPR